MGQLLSDKGVGMKVYNFFNFASVTTCDQLILTIKICESVFSIDFIQSDMRVRREVRYCDDKYCLEEWTGY